MAKKYVIDNEFLMEEWDYDKNNELQIYPKDKTCGSQTEVWWHCKKGHSYIKSIKDRNNIKIGCPYCNNKIVQTGINDLSITHPQLLALWNYDKNNKSPKEISFDAKNKYWWKFECQHERYATCKSIEKFPKCLYCYGQKVLSGFNDFATKQPQLMREWDYERNSLDPTKIGEYSNQNAYWICERCNFSWKTVVSARSYGTGCPQCNSEKNTSFGEQATFYYINKLNINCINRYKLNGKYEIDIFLPDMNIGIEYDGEFFHKNKGLTDKKKEDIIRKHKISLYRIVEKKDNPPKPYWDNNKLIYKYDRKGDSLSEVIQLLFKKLNIDIDDNLIDVARDYSEIDKSYQKSVKEMSLANLKKEYLTEWDYEKNYPITPDKIYSSSGKRVWWKCSTCGESYFRSPNEVRAGCTCPKCSHLKRVNTLEQVLLKKNGSLLEKNPDFLSEWNYGKNIITPNEITVRSNKNIWWKCSVCGHEWKTTPSNRSQGKGCPKCARKIVGAKKSKQVYQYTLDGDYVNTFQSVTEASKQTGIKHISSVCLGSRKSAGGFLWSYERIF